MTLTAGMLRNCGVWKPSLHTNLKQQGCDWIGKRIMDGEFRDCGMALLHNPTTDLSGTSLFNLIAKEIIIEAGETITDFEFVPLEILLQRVEDEAEDWAVHTLIAGFYDGGTDPFEQNRRLRVKLENSIINHIGEGNIISVQATGITDIRNANWYSPRLLQELSLNLIPVQV